MPGSYVAFNLLPSDPFDLLASCKVSLTQRINKYVCMYSALKYKPKTSKDILPFVTTYNPSVPKLKEILMKNWSLITNNPNLARIFPNDHIVAYKKDKSLKDLLVRAKIPPQP